MIEFRKETAHVRSRVAAMPLSDFAVPHLVVDDIFPESLVERINENWPKYDEGFFPEVPGNHVIQMFRRNYGKLSDERREFWQSFNEVIWRHVVSATADAFAAPATEVFGDLYYKHLSLDHPLTLMQADPTYPGHSMHQHFYHCPHWAFTMLLYIDPDDKYSRGTSLHRLLPRDKVAQGNTSYEVDDLAWRANVAMETFHWEGPKISDRKYQEQASDYKSNRLFVFLDGPLALHSVPYDNPDHTPNPQRARDGGRHARRRILRSHVKVHQYPFYRDHSAALPERIERERYIRLMAPNADLSPDEERYREKVLRPFFIERLAAYARAASKQRETIAAEPISGFWERLFARSRSSGDQFMWQIAQRTP